MATPLPPLKRNHRGKECPSTLDIAAAIPNISDELHSGWTRAATKIDSVEIRWPSGKTQEIVAPKANTVHPVKEAS